MSGRYNLNRLEIIENEIFNFKRIRISQFEVHKARRHMFENFIFSGDIQAAQ